MKIMKKFLGNYLVIIWQLIGDFGDYLAIRVKIDISEISRREIGEKK